MFNSFKLKGRDKGSETVQAASPQIEASQSFEATRLQQVLKEWEATGRDSFPPDFICPLSLDIMVDPVTIASGHSYEREYVERWFSLGNRTCPKTNQKLKNTEVIPNVVAKSIIRDWCASHGVTLPDKVGVKEDVVARALTGKKTYVRELSGGRKLQFRGQRLQEFRAQMQRGPPAKEGVQTPPGTHPSAVPGFNPTDQLMSSEPFSVTDMPLTPGAPDNSRSFGRAGSAASSAAHILARKNSQPATAVSPEPEPEPDDDEIIDTVEQARSEMEVDAAEGVTNLRRLSKLSKRTRCRMAQLGAIPVLVTHLGSKDLAVVEHAVTAILNLALEMDLKQPIAAAGAIIPLIALMGVEESARIRDNALGAISNLSVSEQNRALLSKMGIVGILLPLLKVGNSVRKRKDAAIALFNLSLDSNIRKDLMDLGAQELLVDLLDDGSEELEEELILLLYSISKSKEGTERLLDANGLPVVASIVEGSCAARAQAHAVAALLAVAQNSERGLAAVRAEIIFASLVVLSEKGTSRARDKASALMTLLRKS